MRRGLYLTLGGFLICFILSFYVLRVYAIGAELKSKADYILSVENGHLSLFEEDSKDTSQVLYDNIRYISEVEDEHLFYTENYSEGSSQDMPNDNKIENEEAITTTDTFRIMVVFCFGLVSGVIVGDILTRFIK